MVKNHGAASVTLGLWTYGLRRMFWDLLITFFIANADVLFSIQLCTCALCSCVCAASVPGARGATTQPRVQHLHGARAVAAAVAAGAVAEGGRQRQQLPRLAQRTGLPPGPRR